jgi:hypothetical protein
MVAIPLQASTFFGDLADGGIRITVTAGQTLLLPGGWPHAVVTPEDSIAVGGNFLHSLDFRSRSSTVLHLSATVCVHGPTHFPPLLAVHPYHGASS